MFIKTEAKYDNGVILNEWEGKLGIMYVFQKGDKVLPFWVYRQSPFQAKPISKPMPHRVVLGTPEQTKAILLKFIEQIDEEFLNKGKKNAKEK